MGVFSSFMSSRRAKAAGGVTALGVAGAGVDAYSTYYFDQQENPDHSQEYSAAKGIATGAAWLIAEPLMWGITIGQGVGALGKMAYEEAEFNRNQENMLKYSTRKDASGAYGGSIGGNLIDNESAYTMRQRQMNLLKQHKMSTESILGSEARQLHR
jgi:hypothetical protein